MSTLENNISEDIRAIKANLDRINEDFATTTTTTTTTTTNHPIISQEEELKKLKLINSLLGNLSECLDTIENNVKKVDQGLKVTNELIDKWAKILVKNGEISELLLSQNNLSNEYKWAGSTIDNELYRVKVNEYNNLVNKYNGLKQIKETKERRLKEQEELRLKKIKQREEMLKKRVYGNKYKNIKSRVSKR